MKKIIKVMVLLVMVVALSGCMKINMTIDVKSDTEMTMKMDVLVGETYTKLTGKTNDEILKEMEEQIKTSNKNMNGAKFTPITKTIDGQKWVGYSIEGKSTKENTLVKEEKIDGKASLVLTLPMKQATGGVDSSTMAGQGTSLEKMKQYGMEMTAVITMPSQATSNVGEVDGNKVTVDLLEMAATGKDQDIVVSCAKGSSLPIGLILGGVGAVVVIGILVLILKKKKKPTTENETMMPIYEQPAPAEESNLVEEVQETTPEISVEEATVEDVQETTPEISVEEVAVEDVQEIVPETTDVVENTENTDVVEETVIDTPVNEDKAETTQETPTETEDETKKFCPNCGSGLVDNAEFCPNCGTKTK